MHREGDTASDHRQTLEFLRGLQDVSIGPSTPRIAYKAACLRTAQVSSQAVSEVPKPATIDTTCIRVGLERGDAEMIEAAGPCLCWTGFRGSDAPSDSIAWYAKLGAGFYYRPRPAGVGAQGAAADGIAGGRAMADVHAAMARSCEMPY